MIYLVRHGETEWNKLKKIQGKQDISLNDTGREQAYITKQELEDIPIDLIIASPLKRAKETAEIINQGRNIPMILDERVKERDFGEFEGKDISYVDSSNAWDYYANGRHNNMENIQDFFKRIYDFLDDITVRYKDMSVLIVSHGGVSIPAYCYFNDYIPKGSLIKAGIILGNCEVICFGKEEVIDIYDENKNKTGRTKIRHKEVLEPGEYILGAQAVIINSNDEILISKRARNKKLLPSKWECNAGAIHSGEDVLDGLKREIYEELGITLDKDKAIFLKTALNGNIFKEIFVFRKDVSLDEIKFIDGEAEDAKWVNIDEFMRMFDAGEIVYNVNIDRDDYINALNLLRK